MPVDGSGVLKRKQMEDAASVLPESRELAQKQKVTEGSNGDCTSPMETEQETEAPLAIAARLGAVELSATLAGHTQRVWDAKWNPTGTLIASCSSDKTIRIWGRVGDKWECKSVLAGQHQRTIRTVAWSPCGMFLAAASFDATTTIWDRTDGEFECVATLEGHSNEVKGVAWSQSGQLLATCSRDKTVWIWEVLEDDSEYECLSVRSNHTQDVKSVVWHPTEELLVSGGYDDTVNIYRDDPHDWLCSDTLTGHGSTVWEVSFDKTGEQLVTCSADSTLKIWRRYHPGNPEGIVNETSASDPKWKNTFTVSGYHKNKAIYGVDWSADNLIVTGDGGNAVRVFQLAEGATLDEPKLELVAEKVNAHEDDINSVAWSPQAAARICATASDDCTVKLWRVGIPE